MITILLLKWTYVDPDTNERVHWDKEGCLFRIVLDDIGDASLEKQIKDRAGDLGWQPFGDDVSEVRLAFAVLSAALKRLTAPEAVAAIRVSSLAAGAWSTDSAGRRTIDLGVFENGKPVKLAEVA